MTEEDMSHILAGLPVQMPGQPGPDLNSGPSFPPLTKEEINQIFASIPPRPAITPEEIDQIFASATSKTLTTEEMNQAFTSLPQGHISEEELNRALQQGNVTMPQETQSFGSFPQY